MSLRVFTLGRGSLPYFFIGGFVAYFKRWRRGYSSGFRRKSRFSRYAGRFRSRFSRYGRTFRRGYNTFRNHYGHKRTQRLGFGVIALFAAIGAAVAYFMKKKGM